jgi:hypothetical protein
MILTSVIAGEYTAPPAQGSTISETLGDDAGGDVLHRQMAAGPTSETTPSQKASAA